MGNGGAEEEEGLLTRRRRRRRKGDEEEEEEEESLFKANGRSERGGPGARPRNPGVEDLRSRRSLCVGTQGARWRPVMRPLLFRLGKHSMKCIYRSFGPHGDRLSGDRVPAARPWPVDTPATHTHTCCFSARATTYVVCKRAARASRSSATLLYSSHTTLAEGRVSRHGRAADGARIRDGYTLSILAVARMCLPGL